MTTGSKEKSCKGWRLRLDVTRKYWFSFLISVFYFEWLRCNCVAGDEAEKYWLSYVNGSVSYKLLFNLRRLLKFWNIFISTIPSKVKSPGLPRSAACGSQIWSKFILKVASCCIVGISDGQAWFAPLWLVHFTHHRPFWCVKHDFIKATLLTYNDSVGHVVLAYKKLHTNLQKDSRQRCSFPFIADMSFSKCVFLDMGSCNIPFLPARFAAAVCEVTSPLCV